jgi:1-acyl-sn-glycerol-3-phosphate acyltransferase
LRLVRFLLRLPLVLLLLIGGLLILGTFYRLLPAQGRAWLNRNWSRCLLAVCGVRTLVRGAPAMQGPMLWVANHVSWIDIFALCAVRSVCFVAKAEIRRWPLAGWLAVGAGTVFIERRRRHAVHEAATAMQARFDRGEVVGLFPEGTTSEGFDVQPFHASLFEPARGLGVAVQPVALRFLHRGRRSGYAAFVGEETLVANMWRVLGTTGVAVEVIFLPPLPTTAPDGQPCSRTALAQAAREAIRAELLDTAPQVQAQAA